MKIAIIGAGIMGLSCAWRLAQAGADVLLFDARAAGEGATRASLGALWPASPLLENPAQQMHRRSLWNFEQFIRELSAAAGVPVPFLRLGHLEILLTERAAARMPQEIAAAKTRWPHLTPGVSPLELLSFEEALRLEPALAPLNRPARICYNTAQVDVRSLVAALKTACLNAGAQIHEHTPVQSLTTAGTRIAAIQTPRETFPVDAALITAGAWSPEISPAVRSVAPIRPAKGQALALAPPAGLQLRMILKSGPIYLVPWQTESRNEILVGSTTEPEAGFDETPTAAARDFLLAGAAALVPALQSATNLRHWAGLRPQNTAKHHPPIMGPHPAIKNLFICTGHYKTGIGMAPLASNLLAECILSQNVPADLLPFLPKV